jgi:MerR family transcriptional regulator, light-induced transcriptional regulator
MTVDRRTIRPVDDRSSALADGMRELRESLDGFDDARANEALDRLLGAYGAEPVLGGVVLPYLRDLGDRWERGEASIAQEHFASGVVRGRLLGLARGWGRGGGPRAILACAPGELHDLGLVIFGIALRGRGWRVTFLGADTPVPTLCEAARALRPALVVVVAATGARLETAAPELKALAAELPVALAGRGAGARVAEAIGARVLSRDPVSEADAVTHDLADG